MDNRFREMKNKRLLNSNEWTPHTDSERVTHQKHPFYSKPFNVHKYVLCSTSLYTSAARVINKYIRIHTFKNQSHNVVNTDSEDIAGTKKCVNSV